MEGTEETGILILVAVGCSAMLLLAGFIIFFVVLYRKKAIIQRNEMATVKAEHEREMLQKSIEIEEDERERIAKNIHDDLGALISILRLNNSRTSKNINNEKILKKIQDENMIILNKTSESIRSISKQLASPTLIKLGYTKALRELAHNFSQTGEIKISFTNTSEKPFIQDHHKAQQLYRTSQEVINNIVKHAGAQNINIALTHTEKHTEIRFEHDGSGISDEQIDLLIQQKRGLGLMSIRNRIAIISSKITYQLPSDNNPYILITYPKNEPQN